MTRSAEQLRADALQIWQAAVESVAADRLIRQAVRLEGETLVVDDEPIDLKQIGRIAVVGAGKAAAEMAETLQNVLGTELLEKKQVAGWVNVPAPSAKPLSHVHLHAARPAGVNEPTPEGIEGAEKILKILESLAPDDLCLCLIAGGGSALLPAPVKEISLKDKLAVTRHLSDAGANIQQLNTVRKQLSRLKGGGLARACRAGRLIALVISDVLGDPLDVIASGPTTPDSSTPDDALAVLELFSARDAGVSAAVFEYLAQKDKTPALTSPALTSPALTCQVKNVVIGNNAVAVDAAGQQAERLGYSFAMVSANKLEGAAEQIGRHLAAMALKMQAGPGPDCLISGGEPVVKLVDADRRGLGGRNQQLVLAALQHLDQEGTDQGLVILSGGTDGEDGPTDAAGAILGQGTLEAARRQGLDISDYLDRNDAYHFFEPLEALIKTGPTQTNVCDVRVVVVDRIEQ